MGIVKYELALWAFASGFATAVVFMLVWVAMAHAVRAYRRHDDDRAVDRFALAIRQKLAKKRGEGWGGWNDPHQTPTRALKLGLRHHLHKGDPIDVGAYAMTLWCRGERTTVNE